MLEALASLAVLGLQSVGLATLALSQNMHWQRVMQPQAFPGSRRLRGGALIASCLAWLLSLASLGPAMGTVFWVLALLPCGLGVALVLHWRRAWLHGLGHCFAR